MKSHNELVQLIVMDDLNTISQQTIQNDFDNLRSILEIGHIGYYRLPKKELEDIALNRGLLRARRKNDF